ncbi:unnamed protein product, partial [Mesorhabditis belari]|uniref:Uncharacterized protein n=1 Tax=Mesorhabditis belari TaxID=2138241 RepID=A0AAF3J4R7_9BILA
MMRSLVFALLLSQVYALFDFSTCGSTKTCLLQPATCSSNPSSCKQGMSFKRTSASFLEIEMFATNLPPTASYDSWMAVAFQANPCDSYEGNGIPCMSNSPVTECSALNGKLMAPALSWNNDEPRNVRIDNAADLAKAVTLQMSALENSQGQVYCKTLQRVQGAPFNGMPNTDKVFQLDTMKMYAIFMAVGPTNGTVLAHHTGVAMSSKRMMIM